jgi:hypothetical protein
MQIDPLVKARPRNKAMGNKECFFRVIRGPFSVAPLDSRLHMGCRTRDAE